MSIKQIYYHPAPQGASDIGDLNFPVKKNTDSPLYQTGLGMCPAWSHQNSRTFVCYSSGTLQFEYNIQTNGFRSSVGEGIKDFVSVASNPLESGCLILEIGTIFTNFYWTEEKNVWISILPHPMTAVNNNFYHCGAQFNLSNWARDVNIGAVVVDPNKPVTINRGDPLYMIKFHTEDQNDEFNLSYKDLDETKWRDSKGKIQFIRSPFSAGFDYTKRLFGVDKKPESKCPFKNLWKK